MKTPKKKLTAVFSLALITVMALSSTTYAIQNGKPDKDNNWPYVCMVVTWDGVSEYVYLCTGSLIAPKVVLCAGHCTVPPGGIAMAWVSFDPVLPSWPPWDWNEVKSWHTHPDYCEYCGGGLPGFISHDVGILILEKKVKMDEYGELPTEGLVDTLPMKADVDLVGYGVQEMVHVPSGGPPYWDYIEFGSRYYAPSQLIASDHVLSDEFVRLTANPSMGKGGTTFGDSGGPVLQAGRNTILAVNSFVNNYNCDGNTYSCRVDTSDVLNWIYSFIKK
jgi:secreted trypsin-like serine protease